MQNERGTWPPKTCYPNYAAKSHASVATEQIKTALGDLSETLADEEDHIAKLTAERPLAALASAFAAGLIVGLLLRRTH